MNSSAPPKRINGRDTGGEGSHGGLPATFVTPRQLQALRFIQGYIMAHGYSPGIRQIAVGIGCSVKSKASVSYMLDRLVDGGFIRRLPNRARAIEVIKPVGVPNINGRPLYFVQNVGDRLSDSDGSPCSLSHHEVNNDGYVQPCRSEKTAANGIRVP